MVSEEDLAQGRVYPPLNQIRDVSARLATCVMDYAYEHNLAGTYPEPVDKEAFIRANQYSPEYDTFIPKTYAWPGMQ